MMRKWSLLCALLLSVAPLVADDAPPLPDVATQAPSIDLAAPAASDAGVLAPPTGNDLAAPPDAALAAPSADAAAPAPAPLDASVSAPPAAEAGVPPAPDAAVAAPPAESAPADAGVLAPPAPANANASPAAAQTAMGQVTVRKGQNLWGIAGSSSAYSDSWMWPLLYIYNKDRIQDPDIIEPGWQLQVKTDVAADVKALQESKAQETPHYVPHTTPRGHLPIEY
jgi:nucleoid-associated protein YgaU